jgi:hypothetical protein
MTGFYDGSAAEVFRVRDAAEHTKWKEWFAMGPHKYWSYLNPCFS